jgi:hypothetical protein
MAHAKCRVGVFENCGDLQSARVVGQAEIESQ